MSYMTWDVDEQLTCALLRTELQRFKISLLNQLRHEIFQWGLLIQDRLVPSTPPVDEHVSPFLASTIASTAWSQSPQSNNVRIAAHVGDDSRASFPGATPVTVMQNGQTPTLPGAIVEVGGAKSDVTIVAVEGTTIKETRFNDAITSQSEFYVSVSKEATTEQTNSVRESTINMEGNARASAVERHKHRLTIGKRSDSIASTFTLHASSKDGASTRAYMQRGRAKTCDVGRHGSGQSEGGSKESTYSSIWCKKQLKALASLGEGFVVLAIVLNALFYGVQTDYMAQKETEAVPAWGWFLEMMFVCIFSVELICRLATHRCRFFVMEGRLWNWFDASLVSVSWVDVLLESYANGQFDAATEAVKNMSYMRWLRLLRILRVLRVARLLKFMGDLNVVFSAIGKSLKSLASTVIVLLGILYLFSVTFTQISTSELTSQKTSPGDDANDAELRLWWGSLGRSMLSLFEAVFGGVDWDDVIVPLMEVNTILGVLFTVYIGFMVLAIMNVVTGCIVDAAIQNGRKVKDKAFKQHVRTVFADCDKSGMGFITREDLLACMRDESVASYMGELGIDVQDVDMLFQYLDDDESDTIDVEELLVGIVRLRAGTKFIDVMTLLHELDFLKTTVSEDMDQLRKMNKAILDEIKAHFRRPRSVTGSALVADDVV